MGGTVVIIADEIAVPVVVVAVVAVVLSVVILVIAETET